MQIGYNDFNDTSYALKDYFRAPIFTASKTDETRIVKVGNNLWTIGTKNPKKEDAPIICQSLTIEHALVIFGIFAFTNPFEYTPKIPFSFNQLCQLIYGCSNPATYKKANDLLYDIENCWCSIKYTDGIVRYFRVLKNVDTMQKPLRKNRKKMSPELWLDSVELHEEFFKLIYNIENRLCIKISLIKQITSNLARTIYLYLPSRAINATKNGEVFKITLTKLLEQIGYAVPKFKSQRYKVFTQHKTSIISQLDKAELLGDKVLRCKLEETQDKKEYNLVCWVEAKIKRQLREPKSALFCAFKKTGGTLQEWKEKLSLLSQCEFNSYEESALEHFPFWEKSEKFLKMAKCLLGDYFAEYLGAVKNHLLEDKTVNKTPMHMLNYELIRAFKNIKLADQ